MEVIGAGRGQEDVGRLDVSMGWEEEVEGMEGLEEGEDDLARRGGVQRRARDA